MEANDMAKEYLDILDKRTSNSAPGLLDDEISTTLSQAQEEFLKRKYNWRGNPYQQGFENSEKRRKDLSQLTKSAVLSYDAANSRYVFNEQNSNTYYVQDDNSFFRDSSIIKPNGTLWKLPKDFLWAINEQVSWATTDTCYNGNRYDIKPITHDEYNVWIDNTYKKPWFKKTWRMEYASEYNANTVLDSSVTNTVRWYRVIVPSTVDNPANYQVQANGNTYVSTSITQQDVIDDLYLAMVNGGEEVRLSRDGLIIYVLSDSAVDTNDSSTTNDIVIQLTYLPVPDQDINNQSIVGTDYQVHQLITDGTFDIQNYYLTYIRKPVDIVVDTENTLNQVHCELNASTHREIIEIAVTKTLSSLEDPRLRSQMAQQLQSE